MKAIVKDGVLLISVNLKEEKELSSSKKTYLWATDSATIAFKDEVVRVSVNATVKNPDYKD